ncbi:helix-turn-helix domain-containing protein [Cupriavidus basilensis]
MAEHLARDLSVPVLAERVAMSPRNFARVFARQVGETPARYVERLRVEAVRRMLEEDGRRLEGIAHATGFANADVMRQAFQRHVQTTPERYRAAFRSQGDGSAALSRSRQDAPTPIEMTTVLTPSPPSPYRKQERRARQ